MELWCYVEGQRDIFSVSISCRDTIDRLRTEIHNKGSSRFFVGYDPMDLILTKVRYIMIYE